MEKTFYVKGNFPQTRTILKIHPCSCLTVYVALCLPKNRFEKQLDEYAHLAGNDVAHYVLHFCSLIVNNVAIVKSKVS